MSDTIPGVGLVSTEGLNHEAVKVCLFTQYVSLHDTPVVSLVTLRYFFYEAAITAICRVWYMWMAANDNPGVLVLYQGGLGDSNP